MAILLLLVMLVSSTTVYAVAQGVYQSDRGCGWWLRSPGFLRKGASYVPDDGELFSCVDVNRENSGVRPAFYLILDSATIYYKNNE